MTPAVSYISSWITYDSSKFGDDPSTLAEGAQGVGQSSPEKEFSNANRHFAKPFTLWRWVYKQPHFSLLFKFLIVFTVATWEKVKPGSPLKGSQKLILAFFGIVDPLERLIKSMGRGYEQPHFSLLFEFLIVFTVANWEKVKPGSF